MTFSLHIRTAEDIAAAASAQRAAQIKAECRAVIFAVADRDTQASLLAAAISGALSAEDMAVFAVGQAWIESVKAESRAAISGDRDPVWPTPSADIVALAARF